MARLKVFTWSDGFHAFTVAATSRPNALKAWGIGADIFKSGLAGEITEGADHDAALASPGEVIQRGQAIDLGKIEKAKPRKAPVEDKAAAKALAAVEALKAERAALVEKQTAEMSAIDDRRAALDKEEAESRTAHRKALAALDAKLDAAKAKI